MGTIKTVLHAYHFDTSKSSERAAYEKLYASLSKTNGTCFNVLAMSDGSDPEPGQVTLETEHLFSNQWNSTTHRVFDWYEGIFENRHLKSGHYLEITDEMREIRRNTNVCGYCGHQERAERGLVFCDRCLDSPYLKDEDLNLTRMLSVEMHNPRRTPLTDAERAHLAPEYVRRQTVGADSRNANRLREMRADVIAKCERATASAITERDGMLWLMDHGFDTENVIYYSHTDKFGFGWRSPVSDAVASAILDFISEFPFGYTIKGVSRSWERES